MGGKQLNIIKGGACRGKTGGSFDVVGLCLRHQTAHHNLLLLRQKAGLNNHLEDIACAGFFDRLNLMQDLLFLSVLQITDVDHHVDLVGPFFYRRLCLKYLDRLGVVSIRETDDRTNAHFVSHIFLCLFYKGRRDAYGRRPVFDCIVAEFFNLRPCGFRMKQGVINRCQYFFSVHVNFSPFC